MTGLAIGALVGGLTGSPHCIGMCGGFAAASAQNPIAYHLGRLTTYATLGAIAGLFGSIIPGPPWVSAAISLVILTWFCLRLAGAVPAVPLGKSRVVEAGRRLAGRDGVWPRYGLGVVTAMLPCGLVWAALGVAVAANHTIGGMAVMAAFWLGTVPLLSAVSLGLMSFARKGRRVRIALAVGVFVAGAWSISHRASAAGDADEPPACHNDD